MMKHLTLALSLVALPASANPFHKGDFAAGKQLHQAQCDGCHAGRFNGDPARIYTRPDRRANNPDQLAQWLTTCNANLGNNLFPEDELNIGTYLNRTYYKFK